jgi:hypothetical protein
MYCLIAQFSVIMSYRITVCFLSLPCVYYAISNESRTLIIVCVGYVAQDEEKDMRLPGCSLIKERSAAHTTTHNQCGIYNIAKRYVIVCDDFNCFLSFFSISMCSKSSVGNVERELRTRWIHHFLPSPPTPRGYHTVTEQPKNALQTEQPRQPTNYCSTRTTQRPLVQTQ